MKHTKTKDSGLSVIFSPAELHDMLLENAKNSALALASALIDEEVSKLCGKPFSHKENNQCHRGGSDQGFIALNGGKHSIRKPRVRKDDQEVQLHTYEALKGKDLLTDKMLSTMIAGVSSRKYEDVIEGYSEHLGMSKSSVSRAFKYGSKKILSELNESDLSSYEFVGMMIDGIEFFKRSVIVGLGITVNGEKIPLGIREGNTENHVVVKDLLVEIKERGFKCPSKKLLIIIDGGKALRKAVKIIFGESCIIQRCYLHKLRNLQEYVPEEHHGQLLSRMKRLMNLVKYEDALEELKRFSEWLSTISIEAQNSLEEAGEELLTVHKLGIVGTTRRSLSSTNLIESLLSIVRNDSSRVKNWKKSPDQILRWVAASIQSHRMKMRKIQGYKTLGILIQNLNAVEMRKAS